nr:zinc finger, CCHC-type [Tanacetum cinerariifolium]
MNYGLSYVGYPLVLEAYLDASWINHVEDSSFISGWVFLPRGGTISWASKKQTCISGSIMKSKFVALVVAGKEAEWLRNLIHEILIWPKPIAPNSIRCDSAATLAKAYSEIYNGKYRHLGVRHSMIRELIKNEKDAFLVDVFKGGLCVDYTDAELMKDDTMEAISKRAKWENDDYICRGYILNGISDSLLDIYQNVESAKELWDSLESKYMAEDASNKKFLDSLRAQDSDKCKGKEVAAPFVNKTKEGGKNKNDKKTKERNMVSMRTMMVLVLTRNQSWNVRSVSRLVTSKGIVVV